MKILLSGELIIEITRSCLFFFFGDKSSISVWLSLKSWSLISDQAETRQSSNCEL